MQIFYADVIVVRDRFDDLIDVHLFGCANQVGQRTLDKLLTLNALPVVNENDTVATHEIRFGDNDTLGALVANLVVADMLVILTDLTNYCEALREVSASHGEIPSRKGYPGYLYTDLATLFERAGRVRGKPGSVTVLPIVTLPDDDITHPIPDLTGYITEGQIVLERDLSQKGVYPPVAGLPSLSRLMKDGIGKDDTRDDHPRVANQLYAMYAKAQEARNLASIIGAEELSARDQRYLEFAKQFDERFVGQGEDENRSIIETLNLTWELLSRFPREALTRVSETDLARYHRTGDGEKAA